MKTKLILLAVITIFISYSITAQKNEKVISTTNNSIFVELNYQKDILKKGFSTGDYKNYIDESKSGAPALPSKTYFIAIPPESKIRLRLADKKYKLNENEQVIINPEVSLSADSTLEYKETSIDGNYFNGEVYPAQEYEIVDYTWIRNYYCAVIKINTHRYNWKTKKVRELVSSKMNVDLDSQKPFNNVKNDDGDFAATLKEMILNYDEAEKFRADPNYESLTNEWIDYDKDYVKLSIGEDGIYRLNYSELENYSVPVSTVSPKSFKMYCNGNEIPIIVKGENDGSFDTNDYIEFYAEKNYGSKDYKDIVEKGEDYKNYMNIYSDSTIVWITWGGTDGERIKKISASPNNDLDTLKSSIVSIHMEEDVRLWYYDAVAARTQLPTWQEHKVWTWQTLGGGGSRSFSFEADNIVPDSKVKSIVRLISNASPAIVNAHRNSVNINSNTPKDTTTYNYKETVNIESEYPSDILEEGTNTLKVFGIPSDAAWNQTLIDWVDVEYLRYNNAESNYLAMEIPGGIEKILHNIEITNVTESKENLLLYKVYPEQKLITEYEMIGNSLIFSDTAGSADKYVLTTMEKVLKPEHKQTKKFKNISESSEAVDYLILSNKKLQASSETYFNFINDNYEYSTKIVYVDDVFDEFGYGYNTPESMKEFLKYAFTNWPEPKPSYLLLLGDANYDYKYQWPDVSIEKRNLNLVPSYGFPVSDNWFVVFDSSDVNIPQMHVGRLPAEKNSQVEFYLEKHKTYLERGYDEWNKQYLLFSGGADDEVYLQKQIKASNDWLSDNLIKPAPIGGESEHFYKTVEPKTNFGPFDPAFVREKINESSLFISYIGHSGTQTWDNGIISVADLKSETYNDRLPLITDFGCSTGKFAEPNIEAFGELMTSNSTDGQAIIYLGNATWGYTSTSLRFPKYFYELLLTDTTKNVGEAHLLAKIRQFEEAGSSTVNKVFAYSNLLFGDPIISLKVPPKPNLLIKESNVKMETGNIMDSDENAEISFTVNNFGKVSEDSVEIRVTNNYFDQVTFEQTYKVAMPLYEFEKIVEVPVKDQAGKHYLVIRIDPDNKIDELNEDDNSVIIEYNVFSSSVKVVEKNPFYSTYKDKIRIINPVYSNNNSDELVVSLADNKGFENPTELNFNADTLFTEVTFDNLENGKRYYYKVKTKNTVNWSDVYSFVKSKKSYDWYIDKNYNPTDVKLNNLVFDENQNGWKLTKRDRVLRLISAGFLDGEFGSILIDDMEQLPNTYYWGIATMKINDEDFSASEPKYFVYSSPNNADSLLTAYINSLSEGQMLAMTICTDGNQSVLKGIESSVREAIKTLGSGKIDSVKYRDSWCMLGLKGAEEGSALEDYSEKSNGPALIEISKQLEFTEGNIHLPLIKNINEISRIEFNQSIPNGSEVNYSLYAVRKDGIVDSLQNIQFENSSYIFDAADSRKYTGINLFAEIKANDNKESPVIHSIGAEYKGKPELALNYQVIEMEKDTIDQGDINNIKFDIFNIGESAADSFNVKVEVVNEDNTKSLLINKFINKLNIDESNVISTDYDLDGSEGSKSFNISVDDDEKVDEFFEDNNYYTQSFYVRGDTVKPSVNVTFDGIDIIDGEYISNEPDIRIELSDNSKSPINDTSAVDIYLDNQRIVYFGNNEVTYEFFENNPKMTLVYNPSLSDGTHELTVFAKDNSGNEPDPQGIKRNFIVSSEAKLMNLYNYPNPFAEETHFTFKLTKIPDELNIRIFTVAGRLIREIELDPAMLKYDFNKIYWDGRDEDGDKIANGVYLYKAVMKTGGKVESVTQKLAVVR